mmetsp:Transcript_19049/g.47385  ORF Transcript_19049/g.47385 Transcript_19049/m.47385 type:complete len:256 (-) Transcript_19049:7-774(-)
MAFHALPRHRQTTARGCPARAWLHERGQRTPARLACGERTALLLAPPHARGPHLPGEHLEGRAHGRAVLGRRHYVLHAGCARNHSGAAADARALVLRELVGLGRAEEDRRALGCEGTHLVEPPSNVVQCRRVRRVVDQHYALCDAVVGVSDASKARRSRRVPQVEPELLAVDCHRVQAEVYAESRGCGATKGAALAKRLHKARFSSAGRADDGYLGDVIVSGSHAVAKRRARGFCWTCSFCLRKSFSHVTKQRAH